MFLRFVVLVSVAGLAVLGASCGSDDSGVASGGEAAQEATKGDDAGLPVAAMVEALHQPGTDLAPGVQVQDGSVRVGPTFPSPDFSSSEAGRSLGWQAVLVVDGDPYEVWESYVAELGLGEGADPRSACVVTAGPTVSSTSVPVDTVADPAPIWRSRFVTETPLDGEIRLDCLAQEGTTTMSLSVGAEPCLGMPPRTEQCPPRAVSHLYLKVEPAATASGYERFGADQLRFERVPGAVERERDPAPVPTGKLVPPRFDEQHKSRLPGPGERFDDMLDYFLGGSLVAEVPAGGRSLVAPSMLLDCNSGLVAVLELPYSPDEVIGLFDDAEASDDPVPAVLSGTDEEGRAWSAGWIGTAGGYYLYMTAVQTGADVSTVLLTECGD